MEPLRTLSLKDALEAGLQIEASEWRIIVPLHVSWAALVSLLHLVTAATLGGDFEGSVARLRETQELDPELLPFVAVSSAVIGLQATGGILLRVVLARHFALAQLGRPALPAGRLLRWLGAVAGGAIGTALRLQLTLSLAGLMGLAAVGLGAGLVTMGAATGSLLIGAAAGLAGLGVAGYGGARALFWGAEVYLSPAVFAVEEGPSSEVIRRARALSRPQRTPMVVVLLLSVLLCAALEQGLGVLLGGGPLGSSALRAAAVTTLFLFALLPFEAYFSRVLTLLYFDRRARLEGFDPHSESDASA